MSLQFGDGFVINPQQVALDGAAQKFVYDFGQSEGPRNKVAEDKSEHNRKYIGDWNPREDIVRAMVGYPVTKAVGGGNFVRRYIPHSIPDWLLTQASNGTPYLYCTDLEWWGFGAPTVDPFTSANIPAPGEKAPRYPQIRVDAQYNTLPFEVLTDAQMLAAGYTDGFGNPDESRWKRFVLVNPKPSGEFFSLPIGSMYWVADGIGDQAVLQFGSNKLLVYANLAVTRYGVPATSMPSMHVNPNLMANNTAGTPGALELGLGTVNSTILNGYAKGLLLLTAIDIRPKRSAFGLRVYDYTTYHKYVANRNPVAPLGPFGHNYVYRPRFNATAPAIGGPIGRWTEVTLNGLTNAALQTDGQSIYNWYDHHNLYRDP